jgi:hypothetical protein
MKSCTDNDDENLILKARQLWVSLIEATMMSHAKRTTVNQSLLQKNQSTIISIISKNYHPFIVSFLSEISEWNEIMPVKQATVNIELKVVPSQQPHDFLVENRLKDEIIFRPHIILL